jgi:YVTN family beta-propeller protein
MIYVTNNGENTVSVIKHNGKSSKASGISAFFDLTTSNITNPYLDSIASSYLPGIIVGETPVGVTINPNNNMIYVTNNGENTVSVINGRTNNVITDITVGQNPVGVTINPNNNMTNWGENTVSVIDGRTNTVMSSVVLMNPFAAAVNPSINKIYVASYDSNNRLHLSVIDGEINELVTDIAFALVQPGKR